MDTKPVTAAVFATACLIFTLCISSALAQSPPDLSGQISDQAGYA